MKALTAIKSFIFSAAFISLWAWIFYNVRYFDRYIHATLPGWTSVIGAVLILIGAALGLTCVITFTTNGSGTPAPFDPPVKFVATGPYRYVRNPMYIGGFMILIGFGFYAGSLSIIICAVIWILFANLLVSSYEEKTLRKRFGNSYEEYCRNVNRWIPKM